jgi:hypothetical protein
MSRVDVPTLRCDRCRVTTSNRTEMGRFRQITHEVRSEKGPERWDLCPECDREFHRFMQERLEF